MTARAHAALFTIALVVRDADGEETEWRGDPWTSTLGDVARAARVRAGARSRPGAWLLDPRPATLGDDDAPIPLAAPIADLDVPEGAVLFFQEAL